jgi:receptor expression-enhancing protein 5/6
VLFGYLNWNLLVLSFRSPHTADKLSEVESATGYPKAYFFVALSLVVTGIVTLVGGVKLMVDVMGFVYPAYMSFKSMDAGSKDDTQWLTYWVVFSAWSIFESIFRIVTYMIPFYFYLKGGIILWMYHPTTRGAETMYTQLLRPVLLPYLEKANKVSKKA